MKESARTEEVLQSAMVVVAVVGAEAECRRGRLVVLVLQILPLYSRSSVLLSSLLLVLPLQLGWNATAPAAPPVTRHRWSCRQRRRMMDLEGTGLSRPVVVAAPVAISRATVPSSEERNSNRQEDWCQHLQRATAAAAASGQWWVASSRLQRHPREDLTTGTIPGLPLPVRVWRTGPRVPRGAGATLPRTETEIGALHSKGWSTFVAMASLDLDVVVGRVVAAAVAVVATWMRCRTGLPTVWTRLPAADALRRSRSSSGSATLCCRAGRTRAQKMNVEYRVTVVAETRTTTMTPRSPT